MSDSVELCKIPTKSSPRKSFFSVSLRHSFYPFGRRRYSRYKEIPPTLPPLLAILTSLMFQEIPAVRCSSRPFAIPQPGMFHCKVAPKGAKPWTTQVSCPLSWHSLLIRAPVLRCIRDRVTLGEFCRRKKAMSSKGIEISDLVQSTS